MSLFFCWVLILGVVPAGLLVLFSLLSMAQKSDQSLDQLEGMKLPRRDCTTHLMKKEKSETIRVPVTSDFYHGSNN